MESVWNYINKTDLLQQNALAQRAIQGLAFGQPTQLSLDQFLFNDQVYWPKDFQKTIFIDFGSGTGTVLFHVASSGKANKCIGIELNKILYEESVSRKEYLDEFFKANIDIYLEDIKNITLKHLKDWSNKGEYHLIFYSFDTALPEDVFEHIFLLINRYSIKNPTTIVTTRSNHYAYNVVKISKTRIKLIQLEPSLDKNTPSNTSTLRIATPGITEITSNKIIYSYSYQQEENIENWYKKYEKFNEDYMEKINGGSGSILERFADSNPDFQIEMFLVYTWNNMGSIIKPRLRKLESLINKNKDSVNDSIIMNSLLLVTQYKKKNIINTELVLSEINSLLNQIRTLSNFIK